MANPKHGTTVANTVLSLQLDKAARRFEVMSVDGASPVYFTVDGTAPVAGADGTYVLPAAICTLTMEQAPAQQSTIKFISTAPVKVSVRWL